MASLNTAIVYLVFFITGFFLFSLAYVFLTDVSAVHSIRHVNESHWNALQERLEGTSFTILPDRLYMKPGEQGAVAVGVRNDRPYDVDVHYRLRCRSAVLYDKTTICNERVNMSCDAFDRWFLYEAVGRLRKDHSLLSEAIIAVPAQTEPGIYTYSAEICPEASCTTEHAEPITIRVFVSP